MKRALLTYVYTSFWYWSLWWVPGWSPGEHSISLHLKATDCEKIDILNAFFPLNFSNIMTTFMVTFMATFMVTFMVTLFVATSFLISLFLFFPLYDFNSILLTSERASQRASLPTPLATPLSCLLWWGGQDRDCQSTCELVQSEPHNDLYLNDPPPYTSIRSKKG